MHTNRLNHSFRAGQAMIELMIGMIMILILLAGIGQFLEVAFVHTGMDAVVRGQAGFLAMSPLATENTPRNIQTWQPGPDGQRFTADDQPTLIQQSYNTIAFIADQSVANTADWNVFNTLTNTPSMEALHLYSGALTALGFVDSSQTAIVPVSDLARNLYYNNPVATVKEDVWMPILNGLH